MAAKARAAAQKAKERRAGGAEPPVRTPEQVAAAEQKFNAQKQDALDEARQQQLHRRQPALVGGRSHLAEVARPTEAPGGKSSAAIGRQKMMQATGKAGGLHKIVQQKIADPTVLVGSDHPWTGAKEAPQ